ncbi:MULTISPECIES: hypothetical protein [Desulfovibrio]|uniref:Uncharacterized protein n=1 Tax=Desulfovibrio desulfuricans TaxID=876 RepID=A0AA94HV27_DESDE|nr:MULTISPECIES: hypothetical protein [Desulfovibrio]ATD82220.1 hypothetical protein CNY67_13135 [Desulfovibrio sp. G11]SFW71780.1 hypothetical protein SAMN02910291_02701 [Desulfovibrio desulfuricans]SPD34975.1 Hypothetical protein DSVG11_0868 [Desulfovibrio sp. G11]
MDNDLSERRPDCRDLSGLRDRLAAMKPSLVKTTIQQAPDVANGNVAIAQTEVELEGTKTSMPGFATPKTAHSEDAHCLLSEAAYASMDAALTSLKAMCGDAAQTNSTHQSAPSRGNASSLKPISEKQVNYIRVLAKGKAADTISRDLTGKPLEQCSGADADKIIKTLMGKSDRSSDVPF